VSSTVFVPSSEGVDPRSVNKPNVSENEAANFVATHYGFKVDYLNSLPSYDDVNFYVKSGSNEYVLKISNAFETKINLDLQNKAMRHLFDHGVSVPSPVLSISGEEIISLNAKSGQTLFIRILTYLPGTLLSDVTLTPDLCFNFGKSLGKMDRVFQEFQHPAAHRYMAWDLSNAKKVILAHLPVVQESERRDLIHYFIKQYEAKVEPILPIIRKSIIHGDPNDHNLLVTQNGNTYQIGGVLDFGDIVYAHTVNEISVAAAYAMLGKPNPIEVMVWMVEGYYNEFSLSRVELESIFLLSCMRLCTSAVMGVYNIGLQPENREYLEVHSKPAWEMLNKMRNVKPEEVFALFEKFVK